LIEARHVGERVAGKGAVHDDRISGVWRSTGRKAGRDARVSIEGRGPIPFGPGVDAGEIDRSRLLSAPATPRRP
jgi:hypothetical protein